MTTFTLPYALAGFYVLLSSLLLPLGKADVACTTNQECTEILLPGSDCIDGFCTNPYHKGGCLRNRLTPDHPHWSDLRTRLRTCHSEDPPEALRNGHCRMSPFDYPEIRIASQNWESVFFESWILQIILSELMDVPVTIETGKIDAHLDFYHPRAPVEYGVANDWDALRRGTELQDCRKLKAANEKANATTYQSCAMIIPEVWEGQIDTVRELAREGVVDAPLGLEALGHQSWVIPKHTAERDPTLLNVFGLQGKENRRKLADRFKRPTTWKDYCDLVSETKCREPDEFAQRAPGDATEETRMFVTGTYRGYFLATEQNNCTAFPDSCTGHIADFPCSWSSYIRPQTHYLDIALESSGSEASGGYSYSQLTEIWAAANETKSDVIMQWWKPDLLYERYLNTSSEFQYISLTPPTQDCIDHRISASDRCSGNLTKELGHPLGSCDEPPQTLRKVIASGVYHSIYNADTPPALRSPAYEALASFTLKDLQIGKLFDYWLARKDRDTWNFDPHDAVCEWVVENLDKIRSAFVPRTHPRVLNLHSSVFRAHPISVASVAGASLAILLVLLSVLLIYRLRERRVMKHAQVEFMWLVLMGLLFLATGSLLVSLPPTDATCTLALWFIQFGFTLELVPLIVKVAAIHKLMTAARRMKRIKLERKKLFGAVFVICSIVAGVLLTQTILSPPHKKMNYELLSEQTEKQETVVQVDYYCHSDDLFWRYLSIAWQLLLLLVATVMAFQTRSVRKDLNEARTLSLLVYSQFIFVMLRAIVLLVEDSFDVFVFSGFMSLIYSTDAIFALAIYFLPKFLTSDSDLEQLRRRSPLDPFGGGRSMLPDPSHANVRSGPATALSRQTNAPEESPTNEMDLSSADRYDTSDDASSEQVGNAHPDFVRGVDVEVPPSALSANTSTLRCRHCGNIPF